MARLSKKEEIAAKVANVLLGDEYAGKTMVVFKKVERKVATTHGHKFHQEDGYEKEAFTVIRSDWNLGRRLSVYIHSAEGAGFNFDGMMATFDGNLVFIINATIGAHTLPETRLDMVIANAAPE